MPNATQLMSVLNPNAVVATERGVVVAVEDWCDSDGRPYRLEYRSTVIGHRANAWCLYNPWGVEGEPSAGADYFVAHVAPDGFLCLGVGTERKLENSPFSLDYAVRRARYWCTAFSVFRETGEFPDP